MLTLCNLLFRYRRFGGYYCLPIRDTRVGIITFLRCAVSNFARLCGLVVKVPGC
jgi:hypothetical protein